jgi:hypothetical protein
MSSGELTLPLTVTLHGFDAMQIVYTATTSVLTDGTFAFDNVAFAPGRVFLSTVKLGEVTYGSDVATVQAGDTKINLPIQVFDTTTDPSVLVVDRLHFFFELIDQKTLRVVELYVISNPSQRTLVAPAIGKPVLSFSLPPDAENLEFQDGALGDRYLNTEDGFGDQVPVRPGQGNYQVLFSYQLPYDRKLELDRPVRLTTNAVVALVPEDGIKLKGDNFQDAGTRNAQGVSYHMYSAGSIAAGQVLHLTISGRPGSSLLSLRDTSSTSLLIGLGTLGVVLVAAGLWLYRRNAPLSSKI